MRGVVESARTLRLTSRSDRGVPREAPQGLTKVGSVLYIPFTVVTIRRWEYMEQPLSGRLHAKNVHSKSCQRLVVGSSPDFVRFLHGWTDVEKPSQSCSR